MTFYPCTKFSFTYMAMYYFHTQSTASSSLKDFFPTVAVIKLRMPPDTVGKPSSTEMH